MESLEDKLKFSESELNHIPNETQINKEEEKEEEQQPPTNNIETNPPSSNEQPSEPLPTISEQITSNDQPRLFVNEMTPTDGSIQSEIETIKLQKDKAKSIIYTDTSEAIKIYNECSNKISQLIQIHSNDNIILPQLLELKHTILNNLAICYIYSKQYLNAIETDNQILQSNMPKEQSLLRLFKSHKELGETDKALQYANEIKQTIPQNILEQNQSILHDVDEIQGKINKDNEQNNNNNKETSFMNSVLLYSIPLLAVVGIGTYIYLKKK